MIVEEKYCSEENKASNNKFDFESDAHVCIVMNFICYIPLMKDGFIVKNAD